MPQDQPWLLWISFVGPHEPFDTPNDWNKTSSREIPQAAKLTPWIKELSDETCLKRTYNKWNKLLSAKEINELRGIMQTIYASDDQIERLLKALSKRKGNKNTAITITSDHGEMLGDHGMLYKDILSQASNCCIYRPARNEEVEQTDKQPNRTTDAFQKMVNIQEQ